MATVNGGTPASRIGEDAPLLGGGQTRGIAGVNGSDGSRPGISPPSAVRDSSKPNQKVGRVRGFFIIISLWGLIFLQGESFEYGLDTA